MLDFVTTLFKSPCDFQVVPLTSHVWQQSSYQDDSRTQIFDINMVSLKKSSKWGSGDDQVCLV